MTTQWNYDGTLDQSKFSLAATIRKWEEKGFKVTVTMVHDGEAILRVNQLSPMEQLRCDAPFN